MFKCLIIKALLLMCFKLVKSMYVYVCVCTYIHTYIHTSIYIYIYTWKKSKIRL